MTKSFLLGLLPCLALVGCGGDSSSGSSGASSTAGATSATSTAIATDQSVSGKITSSAATSMTTGATTPGTATTAASGTVAAPAQSTVQVSTGHPEGSSDLAVTGSPAASVVAGSAYSFVPTVKEASGAVTYSIKNAPSWASFNSTTGALSGTPSAANVGSYTNIMVSVSDDSTTATMPVFSIAVTAMATGSAALSWMAPSANIDGSPVGSLGGYKIYYGSSAGAMNKVIQISNPGVVSYVVDSLSPGKWYFSVVAYTSAGVASQLSAVGVASIS